MTTPRPAFWALPGPAAFLDQLWAEVTNGQCTIVVVPQHGSPDDLAAQVAEAGGRGWSTFDPPVEQLWGESRDEPAARAAAAPSSLLDVLCLSHPSNAFVDPTTIVGHSDRGRDLLILNLVGRDPLDQAAACYLTENFAAANKSVQLDHRLPVLLVVDETNLGHRPQVDVTLNMHWWWGVIGPLDTQVVTSRHGVKDPILRAMITELAGWDLDLAGELAEALSAHLESPEDLVSPSTKSVEALHTLEGANAGAEPLVAHLQAWSSGEIQRWNGRVRVHSSILAATDRAYLRRRSWMGQIASLFPELEIERNRIATAIHSEATRRALPTDFTTNDGLTVPVTDLELGPLTAYLASQRTLRISDARRKLLWELKSARNLLAHVEPLTLKAIEELRTLIDHDRAGG